jgi:hypothetical protein
LANLEPDRESNTKLKIKTIKGISNLFYWKWPVSGEMIGYLCAQSLPHFGPWNNFSPTTIAKLCNKPIIRPHPNISEQTEPESTWTIPILALPGI